jgi:hypothetical protein
MVSGSPSKVVRVALESRGEKLALSPSQFVEPPREGIVRRLPNLPKQIVGSGGGSPIPEIGDSAVFGGGTHGKYVEIPNSEGRCLDVGSVKVEYFSIFDVFSM